MMTGPVTPAAIASVIKSDSISRQQAADLIQHYADEYADMKVAAALQQRNVAAVLMREMPLVRARA